MLRNNLMITSQFSVKSMISFRSIWISFVFFFFLLLVRAKMCCIDVIENPL